MFDVLILVLIVLFMYRTVPSLVELPLAQWELVHYALAALTLLIAGLGVWKAWQMYKKSKRKREEEAEKRQEEEAERQEQQAKRAEDEDELAYLDELDAEEDARKAQEDKAAKKAGGKED